MMDTEVFGDIYYRNAYGKLYEDVEMGEYGMYEYSSSSGKVIHPFIKRCVPFLIDDKRYFDIITPYGYGGPLITEATDNSTTGKQKLMVEFLNSFGKYCEDNDIIAEFIRFHPLYENARQLLFSSDDHNYEGYSVIFNRHTVAIDLNDSNLFATQFDSKCRNMVRKAEKLGVTIEIDTELISIDSFADIYYETMIKDVADEYYFFKRNYFQRIRDELQDESLLVNAMYEGATVASSLFLYTPGEYAHYHLSATKTECYRLAANNLILLRACEELRARGCTQLHLGGGLSGETDDRLLLFKRSFGREERNQKDFYIGKKIWNKNIYEKAVTIFLAAGGEHSSFFPEYRG